MKTEKSEAQLTKSQVAEIMGRCRDEFQFCFLLIHRAKSEALRSELIEILQRKICELKDSIMAQAVAHMVANADPLGLSKAMQLAKPAPLKWAKRTLLPRKSFSAS